ncbi:hypothetical protein GTCCBUS3UF5_2550 [Geobacillus thermoleovorans CCB_US3_UF5]|uniref:Uncharacterized protein n=1 Tax=Geobacillus thermoleovorans CCB_US3_UF5 TaxID=1111068 RepID=A0ABM5MDD3_GEOTH|nr:hypothetical protein GTCCBUS3UF5_2550 [Geobacillus thermoleovorans CCB_US3_UF5]EPR28760.1 hypothetical protein I656_01615 [Geobacillus sp. WSUCF1]
MRNRAICQRAKRLRGIVLFVFPFLLCLFFVLEVAARCSDMIQFQKQE